MKHYAKEKKFEFPTEGDFTIKSTIIDAPILPLLAHLHDKRRARRMHKRLTKMGIKTYCKPKHTITK